MSQENKLNEELSNSNGIIASYSSSENAVSNSVEESSSDLTSVESSTSTIEQDSSATNSESTVLEDFVADTSASTGTSNDKSSFETSVDDITFSNVNTDYSESIEELDVYTTDSVTNFRTFASIDTASVMSIDAADESSSTTEEASNSIDVAEGTFVISKGETITLDVDNVGDLNSDAYDNIVVNGTLILNVSGATSDATFSGDGVIVVNADETFNGSFVDFSGTFDVADGVTLYLAEASLPDGTIYVSGDGTIDLVSVGYYEVTHTTFEHSSDSEGDSINLYLRGHYAVVTGGTFNDIIGGAAYLADTGATTDEVALTITNATVSGYIVGGRFDTEFVVGNIASLLGVEIIDTVLEDSSRVYAAGVALGGASATVSHDVNLIISGTTTTNISSYGEIGANIYGGGYVAGNDGIYYSKAYVANDINVTISATGSFGEVFAAGAIGGYNENGEYNLENSSGCYLYIAGDINLTISDGTYYNIVGTGAKATTGTCTIAGNTNLNISGGEFYDVVFCGGYTQGAVTHMSGNSYTTITGGTFHTNVFGGGVSSNMSYYNINYLYMSGSSNITVDTSGENVVTFEMHLVAGTCGSTCVNGGTSITFTGLGENLIFGATSTVWGASSQRDIVHNHDDDTVLQLVFDDFHGEFTAGIADFDTIKVDIESSVILTAGTRCDFSDVHSWYFDNLHKSDEVQDTDIETSTTLITWNGGSNSFAGDTLYVELYDYILDGHDSITLIDSDSLDAFQGFDSFASVEFDIDSNDTATTLASYNSETGTWVGGGWELSINDDYDMVVSKIA